MSVYYIPKPLVFSASHEAPPCFFSFCPSSCNFIKKLPFQEMAICAGSVPAPKAGRFSKEEARSLDLSHGQFHMTPHKEFISGQATFSKNRPCGHFCPGTASCSVPAPKAFFSFCPSSCNCIKKWPFGLLRPNQFLFICAGSVPAPKAKRPP